MDTKELLNRHDVTRTWLVKKAWLQTQTRKGNDNLTWKHMQLRQLQLFGDGNEDFGKEHIIRTITKHGGRPKYKECLHSKIKSHVYRRMRAKQPT